MLKSEKIIETRCGKIRGYLQESRELKPFYSFKGIPYGKIKTRFQAAQEAENWDGILDGSDFGPDCPQPVFVFDKNFPPPKNPQDENCLYLNIYVPEGGQSKKAVIVYIHGGAFVFGSTRSYSPTFLMDADIILVTITYRLGAFGFLSTLNSERTPGNIGHKDALLALQWVKKYIGDFGGDENRIFIHGESAGAAICTYLMLSPLSEGLFHGVIAESGSFLNSFALRSPEYNDETAFRLAKLLNCSPDLKNQDELIDFLMTKSPEEIVAAQSKLPKWFIMSSCPFYTIIEKEGPGAFLTEDPRVLLKEGRFNKVPVILTVNNNEGLFIYAKTLFDNKHFLEDLDINWQIAAPIAFAIEDDPYLNYQFQSQDEQKNTLDKIKKFYFSNEKFEAVDNQNLLKKLSNIYGDRNFVHGVRNSALELRKHVPVYAGIFTKPGDVNHMKEKGFQEPYEVPHADELQFFFDKSERYILTKELHEYSKKLIDIWTSFAKTGVPIISSSEGENKTSWPVVSVKDNEVYWLDLGAVKNEIKILEKPFGNRLAFWDDL